MGVRVRGWMGVEGVVKPAIVYADRYVCFFKSLVVQRFAASRFVALALL